MTLIPIDHYDFNTSVGTIKGTNGAKTILNDGGVKITSNGKCMNELEFKIDHKENYDGTEIFKVNAGYFKLSNEKKLELLNLMRDWVEDEFNKIER